MKLLPDKKSGRPGWLTMAMAASIPAWIYACALPQPVAEPAMPSAVGIEQVRDPLTGKLYYVTCNPCSTRTTKTVADTVPIAVLPAKPITGMATQDETDSVTTVSPSTHGPTTPSATPVVALQAVAKPELTDEPSADPGQLKMDHEFDSVKRTIPFFFAKVGVGPQARLAVNELIPMARKSDKIWVRGRTDSVGSAEANKLIAQSRASTIRQEFIAAGVPRNRIATTYCIDCFIASNDTESGRRANRRVDVELLMPHSVASSLPPPVYAKAEIAMPTLKSTLSYAN